MASKAYQDMKASGEKQKSDMPKHKQLIQMLSFRVVPAYYKEIEKVANHKKITVSKLIRSYIKEGMKRDKELSSTEEINFRVD
jgi:predicted DNA-binding ribbon-helix-helix protein